MTNVLKIVGVVALGLLAGCASGPRYDQPSPTPEIVRESGGAVNTRREPGSVRYDSATTLMGAIKQAGDVHITVLFSYQMRNGSGPRVGNCSLHIKSSDSPLADKRYCRIEVAGSSFMISLRTSDGEKSFDLHALGGYYDGMRPLYYNGGIISVGIASPQVQKLRYIYIGPDPLKLPPEVKRR